MNNRLLLGILFVLVSLFGACSGEERTSYELNNKNAVTKLALSSQSYIRNGSSIKKIGGQREREKQRRQLFLFNWSFPPLFASSACHDNGNGSYTKVTNFLFIWTHAWHSDDGICINEPCDQSFQCAHRMVCAAAADDDPTRYCCHQQDVNGICTVDPRA